MAARAMETTIWVAGNKEGDCSKVMAMATRVAGVMLTATRVAGN